MRARVRYKVTDRAIDGGFTYGELGPGFCFSNLLERGLAESPDAHKRLDFSGPMVVFELCLLCSEFEGDPGSKQKEL